MGNAAATKEPIKIQLAFQGGGARLALFYGVIKAIHRLENENELEVTRVAGASAGAIAAALCAKKSANIDALIAYHKSLEGTEPIKEAFPDISQDDPLVRLFDLKKGNNFFTKIYYGGMDTFNKAKGTLNAAKVGLMNQTLGDAEVFGAIIEESLKCAGITGHSVSDLDKQCFINSTDIINHRSVTAEQSTGIVQALLDSSALPFLFRNGGQHMDGGILDNLPIDMLSTDNMLQSEHGKILGISFKPDAFSPQITKATELAKRLLETVINERVASTKNRLGKERFIELPTEFDGYKVNTFSVDAYFAAIKNNELLKNIENLAYERLKTFAERERRENALITVEATGSDNNNNIISELRDLATSWHYIPNNIGISSVVEITANCLSKTNRVADEIRFIDEFSIHETPLPYYVSRISLDEGAMPEEAEVKVFDPKGDFVPTRRFMIPTETADHFWMLLIFEKPLASNGKEVTYTIETKQYLTDFMLPLLEKGVDYFALAKNQSKSVKNAEIRLFAPKDCNLELLDGDSNLLKKHAISSAMDTEKYTHVTGKHVKTNALNSRNCPIGFNTYVWEHKDLIKDEVLRVVYTLDNI